MAGSKKAGRVWSIPGSLHTGAWMTESRRDMSPLYEMHLEGIDINSIQWSQH